MNIEGENIHLWKLGWEHEGVSWNTKARTRAASGNQERIPILIKMNGTRSVNAKGREVVTYKYHVSQPTRFIIARIDDKDEARARTTRNGDMEEESGMLIYNIHIHPEKIYACNPISEVSGGEYDEYIDDSLKGQKVTGDDADLPKPGDVNGDDEVNAVDVVMTNNHIKGIYSSLFCKSAANLKADDTIDQDDVDEMVKLILKK